MVFPMTEPHPTIVGIADIARRLERPRATVDQWKWLKVLPEPDWTIGDRPAWKWATIERWALETGRLPADAAG